MRHSPSMSWTEEIVLNLFQKTIPPNISISNIIHFCRWGKLDVVGIFVQFYRINMNRFQVWLIQIRRTFLDLKQWSRGGTKWLHCSYLFSIVHKWWAKSSHFLNQCWIIVEPLETYLNKILVKMKNVMFRRMHLRMSSARCPPIC